MGQSTLLELEMHTTTKIYNYTPVMGKPQIKSQCQITNLRPNRFGSLCQILNHITKPQITLLQILSQMSTHSYNKTEKFQKFCKS